MPPHDMRLSIKRFTKAKEVIMNIVNKTNSMLAYSTQSPGCGDCGTISQGESTYLPYTEKMGVFDVRVAPGKPNADNSNYFEFTNVKPGAVITIASCVEL